MFWKPKKKKRALSRQFEDTFASFSCSDSRAALMISNPDFSISSLDTVGGLT